MKRITKFTTKLILLLLFILTITACKTKKEFKFTFKLLNDNTYEVTGYKNTLPEELVIPNTYNKKAVTSIGTVAFSGGKELTKVVIPSNITIIKSEAFSGTDDLVEVEFLSNDTLKVIENNAFHNAVSLATISLPDSVDIIGAYAFAGTNLTEISLPKDLKELAANLFYDTKIQEIQINEAIEKISNDAFNGALDLKAINVVAQNQTYSSDQGILYNKNKTELIRYPIAKTGASFTILNNVITIKEKAFKDVKTLASINIPSNIKTIKSYAFQGTKKLDNVVIPNTVEYLGDSLFKDATGIKNVSILNNINKVPYMTFSGATNLQTVVLPSSIKIIDDYAFENAEKLNLDNLPPTLQEVGDYAFKGVNGIEHLVIPASVTKIKDGAFMDMQQLKTLAFEENSNLKTIGNKAFMGTTRLEKAVFPIDIEFIGWGILSNAISLEELTIPYIGASLEETGSKAQFGYIFGTEENKSAYGVLYYGSISTKYYIPDSLKEVTILQGEIIKQSAFEEVEKVEKLVLPNNLKVIEQKGLSGMSKLKELTLPSSLITIAEGALSGATSLEKITLPFLGKSLEATKEEAQFGYIFGKNSYYSGYEADYYGFDKVVELEEDEEVEEIFYYIPESLKEIVLTGGEVGNYAFSGLKEVTQIKLPNNLLTMGDYALNGLTNLQEIDLPESLVSFGVNLLKGASSLKEIVIPSGIKVIEEGFLNGASSLETLILPEGIEIIGAYAFSGSRTIKELVFPESLEEIKDFAFNGLSGLEVVVVPNNVVKVGEGIFNGLTRLVVYVEADQDSVADLWHARWNASNRATYYEVTEQTFIELNNIEYVKTDEGLVLTRYIGDDKKLVLGEIDGSQLIEIGAYAFYNAVSLEIVELPESLTNINRSAFEGSTNLQVANIPLAVEVIGADAFRGTGNLVIFAESENRKSGWSNSWIPSVSRPVYYNVSLDDLIDIDGSLYLIEDDKATLARYVGDLKVVKIASKVNGYSVTKVGSYAFSNNDGLYAVHIPISVLEIGVGAFYLIDTLTIYVEAEQALPAWDRWNPNNQPVYYNQKEDDLIIEDDALYSLKEDYYVLMRYFGNHETWTIPRKINGKDVKEIQTQAFAYLPNLKSLHILDNIEVVAAKVLENSDNLIVYVAHKTRPSGWDNNWNQGYDSTNLNIYFNVSEEDKIIKDGAEYIKISVESPKPSTYLTLTRYFGNDDNFSVPKTIDAIEVQNIGKGAFVNASTLTYVVILDNVDKAATNIFVGDLDENFVIFIEHEKIPLGWNLNWNRQNLKYYLDDEWSFDENNIPVISPQD